jgi:hypothetical protein
LSVFEKAFSENILTVPAITALSLNLLEHSIAKFGVDETRRFLEKYKKRLT